MKFLENLKFLFKPNFWLLLYPYNKDTDKILNALMDKYEPILKSEYTARFGEVDVWIENYPYGFGTIAGTRHERLRSSRLTIERLHNLVKDKQTEMKTNRLKGFEEIERSLLEL